MHFEEVLTQIKLSGDIAPELFSKIPEAAAEHCSSEDKRGNKNAPSQIRRFYDELVSWESRLNMISDPEKKQEAFTEFLPYIKMIRAKVAYAKGRDLITDDFQKLMNTLIREINSPQTLKRAKLFFEAYLGFSKALSK